MAKKSKLFAGVQPEVDTSILTPEEVLAVQAEADAEVEKEARDAARSALKADMILKAKRSKRLVEDEVLVHIDLPPYASDIRLDNHVYRQGETKMVRQSVAQVIWEIIQRTWGHQAQVMDGKSENFYRRRHASQVTPNNVGAPASHILRA